MLKRKMKQSDVEHAREEALIAFLDMFYTFDDINLIYKAKSPQVSGDFMESTLDYVVANGIVPNLTDLVAFEEENEC